MLLPDHQLAENFMVSVTRQKSNKREFVTKYVGIIAKLFSHKNRSEIAGKIFVTQCFLTDHLNHKILNKRSLNTFSKYLPTMCTLVKVFQLL